MPRTRKLSEDRQAVIDEIKSKKNARRKKKRKMNKIRKEQTAKKKSVLSL